MAIGIALGAASTGLGILGGISAKKQQRKAERTAKKQSAYSTAFSNAMKRFENEDIKRIYGIQLQQAGEQIGLNREAANRAYISEQRNLNEAFASAAFQKQGLVESLSQVQGTNAAAEVFGRSAERIRNIEGLGNYGRQQAILANNLARAADKTGFNMEEIQRQNRMADINTLRSVSVPPSTQAIGRFRPGYGAGSGGGGGANTGLMIGNALLQGVSTYLQFKPPGGGSSTNTFGGGNTFSGGGLGTFSGAFRGAGSSGFNPSAFSMPSLV